jgi:hypothetical protein
VARYKKGSFLKLPLITFHLKLIPLNPKKTLCLPQQKRRNDFNKWSCYKSDYKYSKIILPLGGKILRHSKIILQPDGKVLRHSKIILQPDGKILRHSKIILPLDGKILPYSKIILPLGGKILRHSKIILPLGGKILRHEKIILPLGGKREIYTFYDPNFLGVILF